MPRPICVKCQIDYRPEKNGISVEEMASFGSYRLWFADLYKCPKCGHEIIIGFGQRCYARHNDPNYKEVLKRSAKLGEHYKFYEK